MKHTALVVDDNANNLTLEKDLLEVAGFKVFVAENATLGLALARSVIPDVNETRDIPIIFVTASVMAEGKSELNNIANSGFIGKPINTRTFASEIRRFLNKR